MSTTDLITAGHKMPGGVAARLRARIRGRVGDDRGNLLIEALVFMGVIAVTISAFTSTAFSTNVAQRRSNLTDIATQASQAVIEQAKGTPWSTLGFLASDYTAIGQTAPSGTVFITLASDGDRVLPRATRTVRGVPITLNTTITWVAAPGGNTSNLTGYGQRLVKVTATWNYKGQSGTASFSVLRTPSAAEARPPGPPQVP